MNGNARSESGPDNEPLFVLKYRRAHVCLRAIVFAFGIIVWAAFALLPPCTGIFDILFRPLVVLLFFASIFALIDLLLFQELRLYQDRIVLVQRLIVDKEVELANARLANTSTRGTERKSFFSQDTSKHLAWIFSIFPSRGVSYYEDLPNPQDVRKLNAVPASLSGRRVEEFDQTWTIGRLIKEGHKPRVIDKDALDEALSQKIEPSDYDRAVNRALVVMALFGFLGVAVLWWSIIRLVH